MAHNASFASFLDFSTQLYCSGAEEGLCALPDGSRQLPGQCHWLKAGTKNMSQANATIRGGWVKVTKHDLTMVKTGNKGRDVWAGQRFEPSEVVPGYVHFRVPDAAQCLRGKRILLYRRRP